MLSGIVKSTGNQELSPNSSRVDDRDLVIEMGLQQSHLELRTNKECDPVVADENPVVEMEVDDVENVVMGTEKVVHDASNEVSGASSLTPSDKVSNAPLPSNTPSNEVSKAPSSSNEPSNVPSNTPTYEISVQDSEKRYMLGLCRHPGTRNHPELALWIRKTKLSKPDQNRLVADLIRDCQRFRKRSTIEFLEQVMAENN
jgi:hypothetical protein